MSTLSAKPKHGIAFKGYLQMFVVTSFVAAITMFSAPANADEPVPSANPEYFIDDEVCGQATVTITNYPTDDNPVPLPFDFAVKDQTDDGVITTIAEGTLPEPDSDASDFMDVFTFAEDSGNHLVTVWIDNESSAPVTIVTDCETEEPPPPDPDDNGHPGGCIDQTLDPDYEIPLEDEQQWIEDHPDHNIVCPGVAPPPPPVDIDDGGLEGEKCKRGTIGNPPKHPTCDKQTVVLPNTGAPSTIQLLGLLGFSLLLVGSAMVFFGRRSPVKE